MPAVSIVKSASAAYNLHHQVQYDADSDTHEADNMHAFDYTDAPSKLLTPEIIGLLGAIHEHKGKQELFLSAKKDVLDSLGGIARVQSIESSNRIEGIFTSAKRVRDLASEKTTPKGRNEEEIAGYRDALSLIHESHDYIDITPNNILQLHATMYKRTASSMGGHFKVGDNSIVEIDADGRRVERFKPIPAVATPDAMERLCEAYRNALHAERLDPLLLTCMFVFDFTCIHPFNDGNGRMSRLLTLLALYRTGYLVGKYVSIEKAIEDSKASYYEALKVSSENWNKGLNDYAPFVRYMLGVILGACRDLESRVMSVEMGDASKADRVAAVFDCKLGKVTKADILAECPDISQTTVERVLHDLLVAGRIEKVGRGPATGYVRVERE